MRHPRRYRRKEDWILRYVVDRRVLDLGCVNHDHRTSDEKRWLHKLIRERAGTILGVDALEEDVKELQQKGFNVICANVETMQLDERFEVITAGDIIEHVSNAGEFVRRMTEHLDDEGVILISTPGPINLFRIVSMFLFGRIPVNPEHTAWYSPEVLAELVGRYNLELEQTVYIDDSYQYMKKWYHLPLWPINWLVTLIRPQMCETLGFEVRKSN